MKRVNINNLYESPYPPIDINALWVDRDESTNKIRSIHKYNQAKGEWEPSMVSVNYLEGDSTDRYTVKFSVPTEYTSKSNWSTSGGLKAILTEFITSHEMDATTLLTNPNQVKTAIEDAPSSRVTQMLYDMHNTESEEHSMISSCFSVTNKS